jgi:hypothetical protein
MTMGLDVWGLPETALVTQKDILASRFGVSKRALLAAVKAGRLGRVRIGTRKGKYARADVYRVFRPYGGA